MVAGSEAKKFFHNLKALLAMKMTFSEVPQKFSSDRKKGVVNLPIREFSVFLITKEALPTI